MVTKKDFPVEGVTYLLDTKSLGGSDRRSPLFRGGLIANEIVQFAGSGSRGSFATYLDAAQNRWLYAPAWDPQTSRDGEPDLKPVWRPRNLDTPESAVLVNGMVVALESGDAMEQVDENGKLIATLDGTVYAFGLPQ